MFKNTSSEKARQLIGPTAYARIEESFAEELFQTGYRRSRFLADYLKDIEALRVGDGKISNDNFYSGLVKFTGCSLISLLMRDGYTPGHNYPIDGRSVNETWIKHVPEFGLAMASIAGLTLEEIEQSCGLLAGIRIEISPKDRARYLSEFDDYTPTYPRNSRNQTLIIKSYLESFAGIKQTDIVKHCRPLGLLMGLNKAGSLSIEDWMHATEELATIAYSAFGAVGNKWAKREKSILENRFAVLDSNIALLTTMPAQMLYLKGHDLADIVHGLTARVHYYARGLLGNYREFNDYVEFAIKRPFMPFPETWAALGITAEDFMGIDLDAPEIDELFKQSSFRNGMLSSLSYAAHVNLDTSCVFGGYGNDYKAFSDRKYFKRHGWLAHDRLNPEALNTKDLEELLEVATRNGRGVPTMLYPAVIHPYGRGSGLLLISFLKKQADMAVGARFLLAMMRRPGQAVSGVDGAYIESKDQVITSLAIEYPELLDMIFERLLAERNPPKGLTALFLKHIQPTAAQMNKIKGSSRDMILSKDLGL